jgi:hypothetical protein
LEGAAVVLDVFDHVEGGDGIEVRSGDGQAGRRPAPISRREGSGGAMWRRGARC